MTVIESNLFINQCLFLQIKLIGYTVKTIVSKGRGWPAKNWIFMIYIKDEQIAPPCH